MQHPNYNILIGTLRVGLLIVETTRKEKKWFKQRKKTTFLRKLRSLGR